MSHKGYERKVFGHWESDTIESNQSNVVLNVVKERLSRLVKITRLENKTAELTKNTLLKNLQLLPSRARKSVTYDNGAENYCHDKVNSILKIRSYFCQPYHHWEKVLLNNSNELIRQFIPKKTDLANIT